jgi:hypothetical protein
MDFRRLGNLLIVAGAGVVGIAFIWWLSFYSSIKEDLAQVPGRVPGADSVFDAINCLYSSSGICALVAGVAKLAGRTVYEPMLFWFGLAGLALGLLVRLSAKPGGRSA